MTLRLADRLTVYYVAAIAAILAGFSVTLYVAASKHLHRRADERLEAALNTLAAAAEIEPDGVEWDAGERDLSFVRRALEDRLSWRVSDERGRRVDGSAAAGLDRAMGAVAAAGGPYRRPLPFVDAAGARWRILARRVDGPAPAVEPPGPVDRPPNRHDALVLTAATSLEGVRSDLRNLAAALAAISLAVWTVALVTGRKLCRLALAPVAAMAAAARDIDGDDPEGRLPCPRADDELGEMARSFNALLDRLGESMRRQRRFAGDASHQLRTPLTSIQGQVDLALRLDRPPEEYRRVLALVQSRTKDLRRILDALMFLARADAEARRPEPERVALDSWLRDRLDDWPDPRRRDLVFEIEPPGPFLVPVHPPLLGELVNNLLDNAAKYGPTGTPIVVRLSRGDGRVAFSVSNQGPGVDRDDLPFLFDPFFRTEAARLRGDRGVGLGLSVAARIAAAFGGRIVADGSPGRGAVFTVELPEAPPVTPTATD